MHIAFYTNYYLPVINGVVRSVESFREELTKQGHNVFVFAQNDSDHEDETPFIFRYPSLNLPLQVDIPAVLPVSPFVDQLLPSLKLDVIHTHHPILLGQTAARKANELNLPLIFTFHTQYEEYTHYVPLLQDAVQEFLKDAINAWLMDFMQQCQHIVIPSNSIKDVLIRDYGLRGGYTVIPTGMDLQPFNQADGKKLRSKMGWDEEKVLISTGRFAKEKNWPVFLQAAQKVHQKHPDLRVVLIGDGPEKEALENLVTELDIAKQVTFTGKLPFSEVISYLKAADVFGFASVTETQGLVTMEAMAAGLPVAAVDASGTRDIVEDGKQGYLVPNDAGALAESIIRLFDTPSQMDTFRKNSFRKAKTFDIKKCTEQLVEVYEQAIQDKANGQYVELEDVDGEQQDNNPKN